MKPLLSLVMPVRNEARSIRAVLESVKKHVDRYTILDTGSTDGTQGIVREVMAGVPGQLVEESLISVAKTRGWTGFEEFCDFAATRNRVLELDAAAPGAAEFQLMLSGDEYVKHGEALREHLEAHRDSRVDCHFVRVEVVGEDVANPQPRVTRTGSAWCYEGPIQENLTNRAAMKKVLTVCIGGRVRSVALAAALAERGCDTRVAGVARHGNVPMIELCEWADVIVPVEPRDRETAENDPWRDKWRDSVVWHALYDSKRVVVNVGPDVWDDSQHPELRKKIEEVIAGSEALSSLRPAEVAYAPRVYVEHVVSDPQARLETVWEKHVPVYRRLLQEDPADERALIFLARSYELWMPAFEPHERISYAMEAMGLYLRRLALKSGSDAERNYVTFGYLNVARAVGVYSDKEMCERYEELFARDPRRPEVALACAEARMSMATKKRAALLDVYEAYKRAAEVAERAADAIDDAVPVQTACGWQASYMAALLARQLAAKNPDVDLGGGETWTARAKAHVTAGMKAGGTWEVFKKVSDPMSAPRQSSPEQAA